MKITLVIGVTYATVLPALLFRAGEAVTVSEEVGEHLLNVVDENGRCRFAEVADEIEEETAGAEPDGDNGDETAPATVRPAKRLIIGKGKAASADTEGSVKV
jgi:hypothetical protein